MDREMSCFKLEVMTLYKAKIQENKYCFLNP